MAWQVQHTQNPEDLPKFAEWRPTCASDSPWAASILAFSLLNSIIVCWTFLGSEAMPAACMALVAVAMEVPTRDVAAAVCSTGTWRRVELSREKTGTGRHDAPS